MANPAKITLTEKVITKVATNVNNGIIHLIGNNPSIYFYDYRLTGQAAPTDLTTAVQANENTIEIQSADAIDVYLYSYETSYAIVSV